MSKRIAVLVDVYRDYFRRNPNPNAPYVYSNIRAIDPEDTDLLKDCLSHMEKTKQSALLDTDMILPINQIAPVEINKKGFLNIKTYNFEF
ncbi:hypothetical protein BKG96_08815 [Rodentibacter caecimuris]|uniref:Uncharacterized protein n=1 Tax=Rodentibacter caecimuris TaxID=1796644 RepID=A0A1V3KHR5_9PAST|nr:hypothetical protein [Rodentibacter heylii]OOF77154.1 hypothetical protein BKG96_08815 [Rodentibacter heylii]